MTTLDPRDILAHNLLKLVAHAQRTTTERVTNRSWAISRGLDVRLVARLVKSENAVTLDTLVLIADACGLQPWQLLLEDFDPASPQTMPISPEERDMLAKLRRLLGANASA